MQEWMIAMLVISIMLIIRDMAKTILAENLPDTEELPSLQEGHPQKERVEKYAASFQKLADTFYGMPYRKDYLSSRQVERIIEDTNAKVCSRCYQREICWGEHSQELVKGVEALVRSMESGNEENVRGIRADWTGICPRSVQYYDTVAENFQKERQDPFIAPVNLRKNKKGTTKPVQNIFRPDSFIRMCKNIPECSQQIITQKENSTHSYCPKQQK